MINENTAYRFLVTSFLVISTIITLFVGMIPISLILGIGTFLYVYGWDRTKKRAKAANKYDYSDSRDTLED